MLTFRALLISIALFLYACSSPIKPPGSIDTERLLHADQEPENWMSLGGNFKMQHYSPLADIDSGNIDQLGLAWEYDASSRRGRVQRGQEATPIVVDGVMYTSGPWGCVYALDAKTGKELWRFDPDVDGNYARRACCDIVNRGLQVWNGKVYVGTLDGYLVCLDAATGSIAWRVDTFTDRERFYTITSPPQVAHNVVVIGNSGGEFGVRGYITAYDLETGKQAWRFFIVPGDPKNGFEHPEMETAAKTWDPNTNWEAGLGGTAWGESTYDPELNLLYIGTGNSSPYPIWFRSPSGGDNLYLASVLAINPDSGKLVWHYQTTPGEIWDYTCSSTMTLTELTLNDKSRKVLLHAPKNGFFYVLDRETGEFISAEKYAKVTWATHVDQKTGRPVLDPSAWFKDEPKLVFPSMAGAHSWQPMAYSPKTGLAYIPVLDMGFVYVSKKEFTYDRNDNTGVTAITPPIPKEYSGGKEIHEEAFLVAWDPVQQKERWKVKMKIPDFAGGVLATGSGLVFQGTVDGYFFVYDAQTGKQLKSIYTGTGIMAAPMTYKVDGEQYVAVMAGFGGATQAFAPQGAAFYTYQNNGRILSFKVGGKETPLPPPVTIVNVAKPTYKKPSKGQIASGQKIYSRYCSPCHGGFGSKHISGYPDLAKMNESTHANFQKIVRDGMYSMYGMASFSDVVSEEQAEDIHQFLIQQQWELFEATDSTSKKSR